MSAKVVEWVQDAIVQLGKWILTGIIDNSYWICLVICLGALILYLGGKKSSGKWITISLIVYYFLNCLKLVIK